MKSGLQIICVFALALLSCTDKNISASRPIQVAGESCSLHAAYTRDVEAFGLGGSCMVLPILLPGIEEQLVVYLKLADSSLVFLENISEPMGLVSESDLQAMLGRCVVFRSPDKKHIAYHREYPIDDKECSRAIHILTNDFYFFTIPGEYYRAEPRWDAFESPQEIFEALLVDTAKTEEQSLLAWTYVSKLRGDHPYKYAALQVWATERPAYEAVRQWAYDSLHADKWEAQLAQSISEQMEKMPCDTSLSEYQIALLSNAASLAKPLRSTEAITACCAALACAYHHNTDLAYQYERLRPQLPEAMQTRTDESIMAAAKRELKKGNILASKSLLKLYDDTKVPEMYDLAVEPLLQKWPQDSLAYDILFYQVGNIKHKHRKAVQAKAQSLLGTDKDSLARNMIEKMEKGY